MEGLEKNFLPFTKELRTLGKCLVSNPLTTALTLLSVSYTKFVRVILRFA